MDKKEIEEKVISIVAEKLSVPMEQVVPTAHFVNDLGADSLDQVELVMELEKTFDLQIEDDQATNLQTVGSVVEYLKENLNK